MNRLWIAVLCALTAGAAAAQVATVRRTASLVGMTGETIGEVSVVGSANATVIRVTVAPGGLAPGWHGVHFHSVGDCSDVGHFLIAKGIVDNVGRNHGLLNPDGPKEGDLPNLYAGADGSARTEFLSHVARLLGPTGLIEGDGSALIVHAAEDDQVSQPVGNSGARVACAVLR